MSAGDVSISRSVLRNIESAVGRQVAEAKGRKRAIISVIVDEAIGLGSHVHFGACPAKGNLLLRDKCCFKLWNEHLVTEEKPWLNRVVACGFLFPIAFCVPPPLHVPVHFFFAFGICRKLRPFPRSTVRGSLQILTKGNNVLQTRCES